MIGPGLSERGKNGKFNVGAKCVLAFSLRWEVEEFTDESDNGV